MSLQGRGEVIYSKEGGTQGCPAAGAFFGTGTSHQLEPEVDSRKDNIMKATYADDRVAPGKIKNLANYWVDLKVQGPEIGFYPEPSKTWLIVKPEHENNEGIEEFNDVKKTNEGRPLLGSFIGTREGTLGFVKEQVVGFVKVIGELAEAAKTNPQNAYTIFINSISRRWQYLSRTTPDISEELKPLEKAIRTVFLPQLFGGREINQQLRDIIALPLRYGGMGIQDPSVESNYDYEDSVYATSNLTQAIIDQLPQYTDDKATLDTIMKAPYTRLQTSHRQ